MEADNRVHLDNPTAIQQYSGLKYTNDPSNAADWPICCDSECYRKVTFIPKRSNYSMTPSARN
jgi:hypothetical protein